MIKNFLFITFLFFTKYIISDPIIIIVYGTSCAGKSTLCTKLSKKLGNHWHYIDRDNICEKVEQQYKRSTFTEEQIEQMTDDLLIEETYQLVKRDQNVIIDTQFANKLLPKICGFKTIYILVYAPLQTLILRDNNRNKNLKRSKERQFEARHFILQCFLNLYELSNYESDKKEIDVIRSSIDPLEILNYCTNNQMLNYFNRFCTLTTNYYVYPKCHYDLIINTELLPSNQAIHQIISYLNL